MANLLPSIPEVAKGDTESEGNQRHLKPRQPIAYHDYHHGDEHGDGGNDADNGGEDHDDHHKTDDDCDNNDDNDADDDADHDGTDDGGWLPLNSEKRLWVAHPSTQSKGGVFALVSFLISIF